MYNLPDITKTDVRGKTIFLRSDLDVPLSGSFDKEFIIDDDNRLLAGFPTVKHLLNNGANVIMGGHLGRPSYKCQMTNFKCQMTNEDKQFSLEPIAKWFVKKADLRTFEKIKIGNFEGWRLADNFGLLENLRFYEGEETNDSEFSKQLASLAQIYVNDAFAMSHRNHASVVGVCSILPHFAGLRLMEEVATLSLLIQNPKRPLVVIIGGKKIETKLPLVEKMYKFADYVLVGGKIAEQSGAFLQVQNEKIESKKAKLLVAKLNSEKSDITKESLDEFIKIIRLAKTVIWNGPMGIIGPKGESLKTEEGTREIAKAVSEDGTFKIVGGGDTVEFLEKIKITDKFSFISTGGGAMLSFLSGEKLPGLEALSR